jgi:hypothetical protein
MTRAPNGTAGTAPTSTARAPTAPSGNTSTTASAWRRITGYTERDARQRDVIKRFADSLTTTPTWRWAFGAFSDTRGWPDTVGGWNDCLVLTKGNRGTPA